MLLTVTTKKEINVCYECPFCRKSMASNTDFCDRVYPALTLFQAHDKIIPNCPIKRRGVTVKGENGILGEYTITP